MRQQDILGNCKAKATLTGLLVQPDTPIKRFTMALLRNAGSVILDADNDAGSVALRAH